MVPFYSKLLELETLDEPPQKRKFETLGCGFVTLAQPSVHLKLFDDLALLTTLKACLVIVFFIVAEVPD